MAPGGPLLRVSDVVLTAGGGWMSRAIRWATRKRGEPPTKYSHVGQIVVGGALGEAELVEALARVVQRPLAAYAGERVAIYRPLNIPDRELRAIAWRARQGIGRAYGWGKILLHLLDAKLLGDRYVFRRLGRVRSWPICSFWVAYTFSTVHRYTLDPAGSPGRGRDGYHFGVPPGRATPDDIGDFVESNPEKYRCIVPLGRLEV